MPFLNTYNFTYNSNRTAQRILRPFLQRETTQS
jgi:hypothetical protein